MRLCGRVCAMHICFYVGRLGDESGEFFSFFSLFLFHFHFHFFSFFQVKRFYPIFRRLGSYLGSSPNMAVFTLLSLFLENPLRQILLALIIWISLFNKGDFMSQCFLISRLLVES